VPGITTTRWLAPGGVNPNPNWPLHNIVIANIVWCKAYTREVMGASYIAQSTCKSIARVRAMQAGRKNERTTDSCTND